MKKGRIFAIVLYFIFTFAIGIILSLTLPGYFVIFTLPASYVSEALLQGDYNSAMVLVGDSYNKNFIYQCDFEDGGGIVLFETVMQYTATTSSDDEEEQNSTEMVSGTMYTTYMGFLYGVGDTYHVMSTLANRTQLVVTDLNGQQTSLTLLDYDSDGNGTNDGISTLTQNGFVILDISSNEVQSVKQLSFVDCDGNVFWTSPDLSDKQMNYESEFFANFNRLDEYNDLAIKLAKAQSTADQYELTTRLTELFESMTGSLAQNDDFVVVSETCEDYIAVTAELTRLANKKAIPIVIIYFVAVYVIGDFLLGTFLIIKFFRWFLYDVCKVKPKRKPKFKKNEVFGHDYYSSVTVTLDLEDVPEFDGSVQIKYTNTETEVVFILLKQNNYTATQRIKAGTYVNPFVDINRDYAPTNLPDNLEVEGFKMETKIKIIRREV